MPQVLIDGIEYVPRAEIPPMDNDQLAVALRELVSLYYFNDWHCAQGRVWNAIRALSPELAALVSDNPTAAYKRLQPPATTG